ncbi:CxxxxCH/CxxCH domain c-type cytochrome [Desulfuromonas acetexigens]|uniref:Fibronectin type-III domain-containing protein n=1 Tax=Trichloromonas acetexigens TaxID=38815 RepID=A0A550J608_9BACT|nr:hypothetical protein [Desulfuromonas acetexigens]TRO78690.1 hypothetical protein FL622_15465 [Desulfuromonas acetexigens]
MALVTGVLLLLALPGASRADNATTAGPATATPGKATKVAGAAKITVNIPYSGDANGDNTALIEWDEDGGDWSSLLGSQALAHSINPYNYEITGLDNAVSYQIRVTISDPDGGSNLVQTLTGLKPYNRLLHNAVSTGSGKWGGNWGLIDENSRYGEISCSTCHTTSTGNIKRVKETVTAANSPTHDFPGSAVEFLDARDGSAHFGDDSGARTDSNRICEVCHSLNKFHNFSISNNTSNTHQNETNCVRCHKHSQGFMGSGCDGCHGGDIAGATSGNFWPSSTGETTDTVNSANDAGEHTAHMQALAAKIYNESIAELLNTTGNGTSSEKQKALCAYCHANPGADADHGDGDHAEVAFLRIWDGAADGAPLAAFNYDYTTPTTATCSNIDCHNNKTTATAHGWYAGGSTSCLICHTEDRTTPNSSAIADPVSGLHLADTNAPDVEAHNGSFGGGSYGCISCHTETPTDVHLNGVANTPATATFAFSPDVTVNLEGLDDETDNTCTTDCHSDGGKWARLWSTEAFDALPEGWTTDSELPGNCKTCHGVFGAWVEGTSHAGTSGAQASIMGTSHNSQGAVKPGAACEDCHVYPSRSDLHKDGAITLNDSDNEVDPTRTTVESTNYIYCQACHDSSLYPPNAESRVFPESTAFPYAEVSGAYKIVGGCSSGIAGCHGDTSNNWWPNNPSSDPVNYPNRAGAHPQHNITIGKLLAQARTGDPNATPIQEDYNNTCKFCHPMKDAGGIMASVQHKNARTEVFGGFVYPFADGKGVVSDASNPATTDWGSSYDTNPDDGFIYQLENLSTPAWEYPLDKDGNYRQFLYGYRGDSAVRHGSCSNIACHSNAPFTPQWYGDEQPPGTVGSLTAATHDPTPDHQGGVTDKPGTVLLTWLAPGDNGDMDGTAYEYEVYYSTSGPINAGNLNAATRAGGAPSPLRRGSSQSMVVDGLTPGSSYWFAVRAKDQPRYDDLNHDGLRETFIHNGLYSPLVSTDSATTAHADDVPPIFWGLDSARSHDSGGTINLSWNAARDHTLPITYRVYWSEYSLKTHLAHGGTLPEPDANALAGGVSSFSYGVWQGENPPVPGGGDYVIYMTTTHALHYQVSGLGSGSLYNFLVRAQDAVATPNVDGNREVAMALPTQLPQEPNITNLYLMNGASTLTPQASPTAPDWGVTDGTIQLTGTGSVTFTAPSAINTTRPTWVQGISFAMQVKNEDRRSPQSFSIQLGYNNGSFQTLGNPISVGIGRRARRVMNIGLASAAGQVPAGARLAVQIKRTTSSGSSSAITFTWGSSTTKGQILFNAQPINRAPSKPVIQALSRATGGYVQVRWNPSTDGGDGGQSLHYDIYGSCDGGTSWPYIIGLNLKDADAPTGIRWDTVGDGLSGATFNCQVKVEASDDFLYEAVPGSKAWSSHTLSDPASVTLNNSQDDEPPAAPTINHIETRPKQGSIYLEWIAVGNDGVNHGSRAAYYDIRFRKTANGLLNDSNWNDVNTVKADGAPVPNFSGIGESFEVLNMAPDIDYSLALKACDRGEDNIVFTADDNCSPLSPVETHKSGQYYCGVCHSTPPDEPDTRGTHREHGYTLDDCAKCHGDGTNPEGNDVRLYDGRHYDGFVNIGWGRDAGGNQLALQKLALQSGGAGVSVSQGGSLIYQDTDGAGGYNGGATFNPDLPLVNTDSGTCMNFTAVNASGCHGTFSPKWESDTSAAKKEPHCADCHGANGLAAPDSRNLDPYNRPWDDSTDGIPSDQVKASPPVANHGGTTTSDRYVGAHERHLNASFRFAKGDSCRLCHRETMESGLHADRVVDIRFDVSADKSNTEKATVSYDLIGDGKGVSCSSLNNTFCHDTGARWAEPGTKCNNCHGMAGKSYVVGAGTSEIGHVKDGGTVRDCIYCHVAGHPQSPDGINSGTAEALLINNNSAVGINYRSGGIHLRKVIGGRSAMNDGSLIDTLAETCWGCHEDQSPVVSEWEYNNRTSTGSSPYHYGKLNQTSWVGATWSSGYGLTNNDPFYYKRGKIQSIHTANPTGTSQVVWNSTRGRYDEVADPVDKIRCSYCHDVHNLNLTPGDTMTGPPYLRGTWMGNPYEEDGAPYNKVYAANTIMGAVPRGGTAYNQLGGYYIDQNNVRPGTGKTTPVSAQYPTAGWTLESSAGLCTLCHGTNVDEMDQRKPETDLEEGKLWLGTNGHSNAAIGGTFSMAANIFDYSHGRPEPVNVIYSGRSISDTLWKTNLVADMAMSSQADESKLAAGYRGPYTGKYNPLVPTNAYSFNAYDWGATVDDVTTDQMYHQFSCSKCHNPHASRLPKLMITNCLDIRHNTWDDSQSIPNTQTLYTASALDFVDRNMPAAYYASAQTCHRFDGRRSEGATEADDSRLRGGWNKVTPWVFDNLNNVEHKGSKDPTYISRPGN